MNFLDVANIYGYGECEEILAEALHPYSSDLLVGTKAGFKPGRLEPGMRSLPPLGRPEHIKEECDKSLRRLQVDAIDLYQVHVRLSRGTATLGAGCTIGEHTDEILRTLGYDDARIKELRAKGVGGG